MSEEIKGLTELLNNVTNVFINNCEKLQLRYEIKLSKIRLKFLEKLEKGGNKEKLDKKYKNDIKQLDVDEYRTRRGFYNDLINDFKKLCKSKLEVNNYNELMSKVKELLKKINVNDKEVIKELTSLYAALYEYEYFIVMYNQTNQRKQLVKMHGVGLPNPITALDINKGIAEYLVDFLKKNNVYRNFKESISEPNKKMITNIDQALKEKSELELQKSMMEMMVEKFKEPVEGLYT